MNQDEMEQAHRNALEALERVRAKAEARLKLWDEVDSDSARIGRALIRKYLEVADLTATIGPETELHPLIGAALHRTYDALSEVDDVLMLLDPQALA